MTNDNSTFDALVAQCFNKDGSVFYPLHDGSTFRIYRTIGEAVDATSDGTIFIAAGTYRRPWWQFWKRK